MSLAREIQAKQYEMMKAGDADKLSILRLLMSAIKNEEIAKKQPLDDAQVQAVALAQVKQLQDALVDFETGKRDDLIKKTKAEIDFLSQFMPKQLSDEELSRVVDEVVAELAPASPQEMGKIMGAVMKKVKGQAGGNRVREIVVRKLGP